MPELNLFLEDRLGSLIESLGGYRQIQMHGLLRSVAQLYGGEQTIASLDMARRWLIRRYECKTSEVYQELCNKVEPLIVVDKSPAYALQSENLARIPEAFPHARYMHLLRHPRAQGESIMKIAKGAMAILGHSIDDSTDPPTVDPQIVWCQLQSNIITFLEQISPERQLRLRGEDLLNEPLDGLRSICRWLQISGDDPALAAMLHPEESPYASLGPLGAHLGNDINFLQSPAYRPGTIPMPSLRGSLPWRPDGGGFFEHTLDIARSLGYN